jgi:hypothetical protein
MQCNSGGVAAGALTTIEGAAMAVEPKLSDQEIASLAQPPFLVVRADADRERLARCGALRRRALVEQQGLFERDDGDEHDGAAHTIVLVAVAADGDVLGGLRLHSEGADPGLGWWRGSRLVVDSAAGAARRRVGSVTRLGPARKAA